MYCSVFKKSRHSTDPQAIKVTWMMQPRFPPCPTSSCREWGQGTSRGNDRNEMRARYMQLCKSHLKSSLQEPAFTLLILETPRHLIRSDLPFYFSPLPNSNFFFCHRGLIVTVKCRWLLLAQLLHLYQSTNFYYFFQGRTLPNPTTTAFGKGDKRPKP